MSKRLKSCKLLSRNIRKLYVPHFTGEDFKNATTITSTTNFCKGK